jgi:hypothetical protein
MEYRANVSERKQITLNARLVLTGMKNMHDATYIPDTKRMVFEEHELDMSLRLY